METKVKAGNGIANKTGNNNNDGRINNLPVSTAFNDKKAEPKKEETKPEPVKEETKPQPPTEPAKPADQPKKEEPAVQQEPSKKEIKEQFAAQQARKLEETEKIVEQLGKKIAQKKKLQNTIANIDSFTIAQSDEKDDMASDSKFQRCELVISDDDGNEFVTKNPFIIAYVAHEVRQLCVDKLAEVESTIVIP
ncbi:MAG: hypothetical protein JO080_04150 [Mucilaginibacter sp.]|nr:hypothetical protein [Mucilaginibacter sp.]